MHIPLLAWDQRHVGIPAISLWDIVREGRQRN